MTSSVKNAPQWFELFRAPAIRVGKYAFALKHDGWNPVCQVSLAWDGEPLADGEAAARHFCMEWTDLDPAVVEGFVRFGRIPPKPKRIRRWVCIDMVQVIAGKNDLEGTIYAELDDRSMQPINGEQLSILAEVFPDVKRWRLQGRPNLHTG